MKNKSVKFPREILLQVLWDEAGDDYNVISQEILDTGRWSIHYELIFKYKDKFYKTFYSRGATEQQDERPWEYEEDQIDCWEVKPVEKIITVYEEV